MGDISEGAPRELGPRRDARQAAVLAKSSIYNGVSRGLILGCVAPRDHRMAGAGPQLCGAGAGEASLGHLGQCGRGSFRSVVAPCDSTARALLCVLDLGVGTRGPRIARAAMQTRACAATG